MRRLSCVNFSTITNIITLVPPTMCIVFEKYRLNRATKMSTLKGCQHFMNKNFRILRATTLERLDSRPACFMPLKLSAHFQTV